MAAVLVGGALLFVVVRGVLVPDDFGVWGHYRGGALDENRNSPIVYAGATACVECHDDVEAERAASRHRIIRCEACHGPLARHADDPTEYTPTLPDAATLCLRCHRSVVARPAGFPQVEPAEHAEGEPCDACHHPHNPLFEEEDDNGA